MTETVYAQFIDDAKLSLTAKNYYFDRDYINNVPYPTARDWAQGFIFNAKSGYTTGPVGVGLDILALAGFNLLGNHNNDNASSGLLPVNTKNERADTTGELRWTAKAKMNNLTLHVGTLVPMFPVIFSSPARLFQQNYRGAQLQINDFQNIKIHGLYVDRVNHRDSTNYEKIRLANTNGRFKAAAEASSLHMAGFEYKINDQFKTDFFYANLHDVYHQNFIGLKSKHDIGDVAILGDLRVFMSEDSGKGLAGHIDSQHISGLFGFNQNNHTFSLGYMNSLGDTAMPMLSGAEPAVFMDSISADFINQNEQVVSVRYDYDFKDTFFNGLKFMVRYSQGTNIEIPRIKDQKFEEDSYDFDLNYRVQTGILKGTGIRARYTRYRNDLPNDGIMFRPANETRMNVDYTWNF
ncbi:OprD family outer membrane porin [Acinetobacter sichuanensis]|nr:OprD family outer membrane porin [Acinetobacter sichuanensis]